MLFIFFWVPSFKHCDDLVLQTCADGLVLDKNVDLPPERA